MFSFQALLSTALSGSYSQGLIHRKSTKRLFQGAMKAPLRTGDDRRAAGG